MKGCTGDVYGVSEGRRGRGPPRTWSQDGVSVSLPFSRRVHSSQSSPVTTLEPRRDPSPCSSFPVHDVQRPPP